MRQEAPERSELSSQIRSVHTGVDLREHPSGIAELRTAVRARRLAFTDRYRKDAAVDVGTDRVKTLPGRALVDFTQSTHPPFDKRGLMPRRQHQQRVPDALANPRVAPGISEQL